jgi:AraC family transcriptional regulator, positive regulator of tynA and feaB
MIEWSTEGVRAPERYSYWREVVCQTVFNISIEAPPGPFSARLAARSAGPLRIVSGESSAYELIRNRREVDGAPSDHYCIYLQRRGEGIIEQCGETLTYRPNDIAISDLKLPFRAFHADGGRRVVAVVPCALLDQRAPWVRQTALRRLATNAPFVDLARRHMLEMAENHAMSETAMTLLAENLCNLLALASATDIAPNRMQPELQIEAMLAFCRQNLHDAELTPQCVADYLGISLRTLHLRFKQIGQTFGRWVLEERLKACSVALRDEHQRGLNISDIAYRLGFNDLSHFNKTFRARFGMSPREWRASPLSS